jgi:hypothetical protein
MNQHTTRACNIAKSLGLRHKPMVFLSELAARRFASECVKPHRVVMGEHPAYWVVCPADASRLERAGYEIV